MNAGPTTYPASGSHPDLGSDEVTGEIRIEPQGLWFQGGETGVGIPFARLTIDREPDGRIRFTDPEQPDWGVIACSEGILNHPVFKRNNLLRTQVRELRRRQEGRRMLRLSAGFLVVIAAIGLTASLAASMATRFLVNQVPVDYEVRLGQEALVTLTEELALPITTNSTRIRELNAIADRLARGLPPHPYRFTFRLVEAPWPNAMALPGGSILVTTGLFATAANSEEVAGVLAHEMAHVTHRHGLRRLIATAGPYYLMRLFISDRQALLSAMGESSHLLRAQSYSRDLEREADVSGWTYLVAAHIDPRGLGAFLEKTGTREAELIPSILRSHPPDQERIDYLDRLWQESRTKPRFQPLPPLVHDP